LTTGAAVLAGVVVSAASAGCGSSAHLDELKSDDRPYYWVGESFDGFELTHAETYAGRFSTFVYGSCKAPRGEGGCTPPLEVQNARCRSGSVNVAIFGRHGLAERAANALRPLNAAARRAGKPLISFDRSLLC
jgi:hypothetical protein